MESTAKESDYRAYVGPLDNYDRFAALQFNLLTTLGLRDTHTLLDIGCGSLRAGRLFIPYLRAGNYFGIEPVPALIDEGFRNELGFDIAGIKKPTFVNNDQFQLDSFGRSFDFLLAQSIFSHTTRQQLQKCLQQAAKVMTPTSYFVATYFKGDSDYAGDTWTVKAVFREGTMAKLIEEQGLEWSELSWPHPDMQTWLLIRKADAVEPVLPANPVRELIAAKEQLRYCQEKLARLQNNFYVKAGLTTFHYLRKFKYALQRIRISSSRAGEDRK